MLDWVLTHPSFVVVDFDLATLQVMTSLDSIEIHDRIIAATARLLAAVVITRDPLLAGATRTFWG